ncbi:S-adenosyl-L-methionine-dependent tRNA 4-demethylwyosine synthase TYW1-like isoform X2 [Clytia hemisphaerica]|uniref:S-adenosyl-L-methionine-dependent tRNA 4-demethylwyosine synthase TYW1 n=1 Tax=Clytia hemisphaerica TaxID=252671 RepID=A0A7M5UP91_9CNID
MLKIIIKALIALSVVEAVICQSTTLSHDFVIWWSYARFPITGFVFGTIILTWVWIYLNRDRFVLIDEYEQQRNQPTLKIFYGTQTGTSEKFAGDLMKAAAEQGLSATVIDIKEKDPEQLLTNQTDGKSICVFIVSTFVDGTPPESCNNFWTFISDSVNDFRVSKLMLKGMKYTVFGLGNSLYKDSQDVDNYNVFGMNLDENLERLSATRYCKLGLGDDNIQRKDLGNISEDFKEWYGQLLKQIAKDSVTKEEKINGVTPHEDSNGSVKKVSDEKPATNGDVNYESESDSENTTSGGGGCKSGAGDDGGLVDVEDIGVVMGKVKQTESEFDEGFVGEKSAPNNREMITPMLKKSLEKQGYKLIGSHSGVKICRWTKSMMRGRGGCYKHTFYGIESHRCMETTPSLACANKCVFCWRHHTNPVGTEWKWKMDEPKKIVDGALENHYKMVKQFRGVPGVKAERYTEAMNVQHCALSLVGEPIMYPEINELINLLHSKMISTFLVTNAQFPDAIRNLKPVTQLYVSVDASTKESLKKIDRPLFRDFWQRFLESLTSLSDKGQRTVYRLTLVKAFNTEEIEGYAKLVSLGKPGFIEVKGVTYCGDSKASSLTMENVPWHQEVVGFVQQLAESLPDYEIASEHEHSNCVLLAHKRFKINNKWHTWIDYPKYHQLMKDYEESNGTKTFKDIDYMEITPEWAVFGNPHRGFDPDETRWHRKKKADVTGGC